MNRRAGVVLLAAVLSAPLPGAQYAVLAGISAYQNGIHQLEGPAEDIRAVKDMLIRQGYADSDVVVLLNDQATRRNILQSLGAKVDRLKAGDRLFFYFSGHGTSAFDKNNQEISPAIGPDSGGLIPFDLSLKSMQAVVDSLIIGRRDLRPVLARVPPGAQAFVVLDACYSENSVKSVGLWNSAAPRSAHPLDLIAAPGGNAPGTATGNLAPAAEPEPYPYSNVVALAAASKSQTALDIGSELLRQGARTVDGRPHGALTNSVLLGLTAQADTNRDGSISYDELYRFVRHEMEKYPHQPQLLSPAGFSLDQPVFGSRGVPRPASQSSEVQDKIRVKLETRAGDMEARLRAMPDVELTAERYQLLIRADAAQWQIYDAGSVLIKSVPMAQTAQVAARVRAYGQVARLRNWSNPGQNFNVKIDVEPDRATGYDRLRSTFRIGEPVRFRIAAEQRAYLLLLDINKDGKISVLFPGSSEDERGAHTANRPVEFVIPATVPAGSDQLKLIGFTDRPARWADWSCTASACPEFEPADPRLQKLLEMLGTTSGTAEASLRVITQN